jgi:hypothetical protein
LSVLNAGVERSGKMERLAEIAENTDAKARSCLAADLIGRLMEQFCKTALALDWEKSEKRSM